MDMNEETFGMHELQIENNHLKNYLIALNEKLVVLNDLKKDFEQSQQKILTSEGARGDLQDHIQKATV